jgi:RNA polymerase sigma factor (sigma-70 family)
LPPITQYTELELVSLLKSRDRQAYSYLYDNYAGALYGLIMKVLNNEETAKDVLQEVFVKIWRSIDSYDAEKGRLYTWMLNIARNSAIDVLRSLRFNQEKKTSGLEHDVYNNESNLSNVIKTDQMGLKKLVNDLKDEHREIIDLAYFKGYTQQEISEELNIPLGTVKTRSRNALIQLKNLMK